jgi:protein gp37
MHGFQDTFHTVERANRRQNMGGKWTWNPVTGCLHDCDYCYARDYAERFFPEKFQPTFHPERLKAPHVTPLPPAALALTPAEQDAQGWRNVFVCSMADLFGRWVQDEVIEAVLAEVRAAPQWNFLFLTKFPQRLAAIDWAANAWVGTTVDEQYRVAIAEKAFREVNAPVKWLSCEPLLEDLTFGQIEVFDLVVLGGQSESTRTPAFQPPWAWVQHLLRQTWQADVVRETRGQEPIRVYWKPNLTVCPQEYTGALPAMSHTAAVG